jgi:hypothetical protein
MVPYKKKRYCLCGLNSHALHRYQWKDTKKRKKEASNLLKQDAYNKGET